METNPRLIDIPNERITGIAGGYHLGFAWTESGKVDEEKGEVSNGVIFRKGVFVGSRSECVGIGCRC